MQGTARGVLGAVALASSLVLVAALALHRIDVADFFWQYRTGELILSDGIPHRDTLTFASAGAEWIELRWLFCLLQLAVCTVGGFGAATLAATFLVVASFALCVEAAKGWRAPVSTAFVVGLAAVASSERFVVRPELFSFLFLALYLVLICRWRGGGGRGLWLLPAIQVVWTNSHALFALGPALLVQLWIVEAIRARRSGDPSGRLRQASLVLVLVFAACLLNPYGLSGALFPLRLLAQTQGTLYKEAISELKGPIEFSGAFTVQAFYLLVALTLASAAFARRRADAFLGLVCATHAFLAFSSVRNLPLFALAAVPFLVSNLRGRGVAPVVARMRPWAAVGVSALCLTGAGLSASNALSLLRSDKRVFGIGLAPNAYPLGSLDFLRARGWSGKVFNTLVEGGVLEANGWSAYFDPRLEVHSESVFREGLAAAHDPAAFRRIVERYGCRVALVALDCPFYNNIASKLGWKLVAFDAAGAVFADPSLAATWPALDVESSAEAIWEDSQQWPEASRVVTLEEMAGFFVAIGAFATAATWANRAIELAPNRRIAYEVRERVERAFEEARQTPSAIRQSF